MRDRSKDGYFVYNGHRLIIMNERTKKFTQNPECKGVVGIVDIPKSILRPGNSKQSFGDQSTEKSLMNVFDDHAVQYLKDVMKELFYNFGELENFWKEMGYFNGDVIPSNEEIFKKKRFYKGNDVVQCDKCLKWRHLRKDIRDMDKVFPDAWCCVNQLNQADNKYC